MVLEEPPEPQRLQLLNDVWKVVMKLKTPAVSNNILKHVSPATCQRLYESYHVCHRNTYLVQMFGLSIQ